jgi:glucosylceramidase
MHVSPKEMTDFVQFHLGPRLEQEGWGHIKILGYDQNRAGLNEWVDVMFENEETSKYYAGTAVHWYESTYDYFGEALQYAHQKAPTKHLIQTEGCVDAEVPHWKNDAWYWSKEATDWGWDWASEEEKYLHPKYVPVHRYAGDMIGCFNNWVDGWIDWNMVLDRQGGPNWFKNWCVAPVIVDTEMDEVYFTPLFYIMKHFSRFIRPGAVRIGFTLNHKTLKTTAVKNPDGNLAVIVFNPGEQRETIQLNYQGKKIKFAIDAQALQTIVINQTLILNEN